MMQARGNNSRYTPILSHRERLVEALIASGWVVDRHGNYLKVIVRSGAVSKYRVKLKDLVCRIEVLVDATEPGEKSARMWVKVGGCYYKDIVFDPTGLIRIGSYKFGRAR